MELKGKITIVLVAFVSIFCSAFVGMPANAEGEEDVLYTTHIAVSPMREGIVVNPGDTYVGSFMVTNPGYSETPIDYITEIKPFYVDENYDPLYENVDGKSQMVEWTTITSNASGTLEPNEVAIVEYKIEVPKDAPAGGQYAAINATVDLSSEEDGEGLVIGEQIAISHVILAEVTGKTISSGQILDLGVQSFVLGGNVKAYSVLENAGNIHGLAKYTMKVYPLFSDEVLYTNEGIEEDHYVLPGRTFVNESYWEETPMVGIFNVYYKVEFMGATSEVTRMVIVCPWWLLMIFVVGLLLLILRIITLVKLHKKRDVLVE